MFDKPSKRVAIVQSCYIPWKGFFDLIAAVDEFIIGDDVQYTKGDWRNRNVIKTPQGPVWLTVPVKIKGKHLQSIREAEIDGIKWQQKHWHMLCQHYRTAGCFKQIAPLLEPYYLQQSYTHISELNCVLIQKICEMLLIKTPLTKSWNYTLVTGKTERLISLCQQAGATEYISGPAAQNYIIPELFEQAGIKLTWFDYSEYPEYPQLWAEFKHEVSIIDLLFNCGPDARSYMKY